MENGQGLRRLEELLNAAAAEGYTEIAREFPVYGPCVPSGLPVEGIPDPVPVTAIPMEPKWAYLLRKPSDDARSMFGELRQMMASMGFVAPPAGKLVKLPDPGDPNGA